MISFFGGGRENEMIISENKDEFLSLAKSGQSLQGENTLNLESFYSTFYKSLPQSIAVGSATDGLFFLLRSINLKPGSKIAVTAFSFIASASSIIRAGHIPIFIDVDEEGNMEFEAVKHCSDLACIVAVSIFGQPLAFKKIMDYCERNGVYLIEDAAQLDFPILPDFKSDYYIGSVVSYDPTKIFSCFGSGGLVITQSKAIGEKIRYLRYHGDNGRFLGYNSQLSELSSWVILKKIHLHIESWREKRKDIARKFNCVISSINALSPLNQNIKKHSLHKYVVKCQNNFVREHFRSFLFSQNIPSRIHYERPLPSLKLFECNGTYPAAKHLSKVCLSLPIYPLMSDIEVEAICVAIQAFGLNKSK